MHNAFESDASCCRPFPLNHQVDHLLSMHIVHRTIFRYCYFNISHRVVRVIIDLNLSVYLSKAGVVCLETYYGWQYLVLRRRWEISIHSCSAYRKPAP